MRIFVAQVCPPRGPLHPDIAKAVLCSTVTQFLQLTKTAPGLSTARKARQPSLCLPSPALAWDYAAMTLETGAPLVKRAHHSWSQESTLAADVCICLYAVTVSLLNGNCPSPQFCFNEARRGAIGPAPGPALLQANVPACIAGRRRPSTTAWRAAQAMQKAMRPWHRRLSI